MAVSRIGSDSSNGAIIIDIPILERNSNELIFFHMNHCDRYVIRITESRTHFEVNSVLPSAR